MSLDQTLSSLLTEPVLGKLEELTTTVGRLSNRILDLERKIDERAANDDTISQTELLASLPKSVNRETLSRWRKKKLIGGSRIDGVRGIHYTTAEADVVRRICRQRCRGKGHEADCDEAVK